MAERTPGNPGTAIAPQVGLGTANALSELPLSSFLGRTDEIDAICDKIDRLPLAVELAAARTSVLPLPALRDRLERRLDVLTGGPRDAPGRQRTMRATIAWSYDLLAEPEQRLYRRLGVFVGGFTLEAVQAVAGDDQSTLDEVAALTAASLVMPMATQAGEPRYTMLETIREYAFEQLVNDGEDDAARSALLQHLIDIAERLWAAPAGREVEIWLARSVGELANIRASLGWAVDRDPVQAVRLASAAFDLWNYHTGADEGRLWLDRALASLPNLPPTLRALRLCVSGGLARDLRDLTQAVEDLSEAATLAEAINETRLLNMASGLLAAAVSILNSAGITPRPDDTSTIDRTTTETRSALGEAAFDMAWTSGSNLDLDAVFSVVDEAVVALAQPAVDPAHGLSPRETEVLRLVAAGKSNRAIAEDLSTSERTAENHVFHILAKLRLEYRTAAAAWAVRHDLA